MLDDGVQLNYRLVLFDGSQYRQRNGIVTIQYSKCAITLDFLSRLRILRQRRSADYLLPRGIKAFHMDSRPNFCLGGLAGVLQKVFETLVFPPGRFSNV